MSSYESLEKSVLKKLLLKYNIIKVTVVIIMKHSNGNHLGKRERRKQREH